MGFFYSDVEVDPYYKELKEELDNATELTHPHVLAVCDTWEEVIERVLPKHGFWYKVPEDQKRYRYSDEYVVWYYEGLVYKGKYRLFIDLYS